MATAAPFVRRTLVVVSALAALGAHPGLARADGLLGAAAPVATVTQAAAPLTSPVQSVAPAAPVEAVTSVATQTVAAATTTVSATADTATTTVAAATAPVTSTATKTLEHVTSTATSAVAPALARGPSVPAASAVGRPSSGPPVQPTRTATPATVAAKPVAPRPAHTAPTKPVRKQRRRHPQHPQLRPTELPSAMAHAAPAVERHHAVGPASRVPAAPRRDDRVPAPGQLDAPAAGGAPSTGTGVVLLAILTAFVLAAPSAGRWLRPALALGPSPVTVSPDDSPG